MSFANEAPYRKPTSARAVLRPGPHGAALGIDVFRNAVGRRNGRAVLLQFLDMSADRAADFALDQSKRFAAGDAIRQIRHISRIVPARFLDQDQVAHPNRSFPSAVLIPLY